jgi:lysophospholipase L1-like esterase
MRDMTDAMYDPQRWPFVSHQRGTELFIEHIENRICPTITSDQFIGGQSFAFSKATAGKKRLQILLLGDSSTEASIPKKFAPREPQFEDVIRILLASEKDLPPADVINEGVSGETIRRLIDSGRYDKAAAKLPGLDYIFIRYGLNDHSKCEDFETNFPKDFHELLARLRKDHPGAMLIPMTVMPWANEAMCMKINNLVRQVAMEEKLTLFDIYPRYDAELKRGPDILNYRRFPLAKIPENLRAFAFPYVSYGKEATVVVLDNHLDGIFGHLPGWFGDRHPNLAGYNVIADETVKFLAPIIRARQSTAK